MMRTAIRSASFVLGVILTGAGGMWQSAVGGFFLGMFVAILNEDLESRR